MNMVEELRAVAKRIREGADLRGYANAAHLHGIADTLDALADAESVGWDDPEDLGELGVAIDRLNAGRAFDAKFAESMDTLTGLTVWAKP